MDDTYASNAILDESFHSPAGSGSLQQQFTKTNPQAQGCLNALIEMEALIPRVDTSRMVNGIHNTVEYLDQHRDLSQELLGVYVLACCHEVTYQIDQPNLRNIYYNLNALNKAFSFCT